MSALQGSVSRTLPPLAPVALSVTHIHGGDAYNVIPDTMSSGGTVRWLAPERQPRIETAFRRIVERVASVLGAAAEVDLRVTFSPVVNDATHATAMGDAATDLVDEAGVDRTARQPMIAEDANLMPGRVPGAHIQMGIGDGTGLHTSTWPAS